MLSKLRALEERRPNLARLERVGSSVKGKHAQENIAKHDLKHEISTLVSLQQFLFSNIHVIETCIVYTSRHKTSLIIWLLQLKFYVKWNDFHVPKMQITNIGSFGWHKTITTERIKVNRPSVIDCLHVSSQVNPLWPCVWLLVPVIVVVPWSRCSSTLPTCTGTRRWGDSSSSTWRNT